MTKTSTKTTLSTEQSRPTTVYPMQRSAPSELNTGSISNRDDGDAMLIKGAATWVLWVTGHPKDSCWGPTLVYLVTCNWLLNCTTGVFRSFCSLHKFATSTFKLFWNCSFTFRTIFHLRKCVEAVCRPGSAHSKTS